MSYYDICTLPVIRFAHEHSAQGYTSFFRPNSTIMEVGYVVEGALHMQKDDQSYTAEKGDIICFICDSYIHGKSDTFHCHHTVSANVDWVKTSSANGLYLPFVTKASPETEEITEIIDSFVYKPYLYENAQARSAGDFLRILNKIDTINRGSVEFHEPVSYLLVTRAKKYVADNLYKKITQAELAEYLNVTPQHLCRVFKSEVGTTLMKYVNQVKLQKIQDLMEKEKMKLYEAAQLMGYSDAAYVSHLYKKTFGRSITSKPSQSNIIVKPDEK